MKNITYAAITCGLLFCGCNSDNKATSGTAEANASAFVVDNSMQYYGDVGQMPGFDAEGANWKVNKPDKGDTMTPLYKLAFTDSSIIFNETEYAPRKITLQGKTYYIVEGDQRLSEAAYFRYKVGLWAQSSPRFERDKSHKLVMSTTDFEGRQQNKWKNGDTLRYAVIRKPFDTDQQYEMVKRNARQAFDEWEGICNIHFEHLPEYDSKSLIFPEKPLTFIISMLDMRQPFVATSFYPDWDEMERILYVNKEYFRTGYDKVGVFRHEAGHMLGFLHEHIRPEAPPVCEDEVLRNPIPSTAPAYDRLSVMHYYCGGAGSTRLTFSEQDKKGAAAAYPHP